MLFRSQEYAGYIYIKNEDISAAFINMMADEGEFFEGVKYIFDEYSYMVNDVDFDNEYNDGSAYKRFELEPVKFFVGFQELDDEGMYIDI